MAHNRPVPKHPLLWLFLTAFTVMLWLAACEGTFHAWILNRAGELATANVTEVRRGRRGSWTVKYRFVPPVSAVAYTQEMLFWPGTASSYVTQSMADECRRTWKVPIVYWPRKPWINRPEPAVPFDRNTWLLGGFAAFMTFMVWVSVSTLREGLAEWQEKRRQRAAVRAAAPPKPRPVAVSQHKKRRRNRKRGPRRGQPR